jgi:hypothetical protein
VQDGGGSADLLHLRDIDKPAVAAGRVLVNVTQRRSTQPMTT